MKNEKLKNEERFEEFHFLRVGRRPPGVPHRLDLLNAARRDVVALPDLFDGKLGEGDVLIFFIQ